MKGRWRLSTGIVLLLLGAYLLAGKAWGLTGAGAILLLLGAIFLALSAAHGFSGPLLPGGILAGLGAAILLEDRLSPWIPVWGTILLGLGAGFLLVAVVDLARHRSRRPSPVVPGIILAGIGFGAFLARSLSIDWSPLHHLARLWPWAVVLAGLFLVVRALLARS